MSRALTFAVQSDRAARWAFGFALLNELAGFCALGAALAGRPRAAWALAAVMAAVLLLELFASRTAGRLRRASLTAESHEARRAMRRESEVLHEELRRAGEKASA